MGASKGLVKSVFQNPMCPSLMRVPPNRILFFMDARPLSHAFRSFSWKGKKSSSVDVRRGLRLHCCGGSGNFLGGGGGIERVNKSVEKAIALLKKMWCSFLSLFNLVPVFTVKRFRFVALCVFCFFFADLLVCFVYRNHFMI
ncbi:hypothetical protein CEXT_514871 [Caerostris extrusa]|uniref:Transmembrane protein n=1 Tax=Caerostris extrusa TaxID=172846 RepID=A0AAV4SPL7_CAEEX|nr:hypothetical protein CEXT_514871 [Caerostris extrusa]